ncbi:MAG TPA: S41 family peptidase [Chryseosolibacter sp.]
MTHSHPNKYKAGWFAMLAALLVLVSCREDNDPAPAVETANTKINNWIYSNMEFWYYWNNQLPSSTDKNQEPDDYFQSLLVGEDRFSWIQPNYQELLNSLQGITKESGYEYVLYRESEGSNNVIAQILYTKPNSPAAAAGLKRGDVISKINNQQLTTDNYRTLLEDAKKSHALTFKAIRVGENSFDAEKTIAVDPVEYTENPNYYTSVIDLNGRKVGYYVYNFFSNGTNGSNVYDNEMQSIFANFKSQGITDLVLDLRFNSGGSESSAQSLASFIGKGVDASKTFATRVYNAKVEEEILKDPDLGQAFLTTKFQAKTANIGGQLSGGRVYVLTSSRTASASELVINALKPFMDVFIIGDVTYGKNVGSISLYDKESTTNKWGMQPIVVKVFNSLGQSDYATGFQPNVLDEDNSLYLYPLGDQREVLLAQAIGQITGAATNGRTRTPEETKESIGHSLDQKRRSFNLVIDRNVPDALQLQY